MKAFRDQVVVITGATSGIGRTTALAFAEQGASVVVAGRREAEGADTVKEIEKRGAKGLFVRTDVSNEDDVSALVAATVAKFGRLDFAFNNAGVHLESGPITEVTSEVIDRTLAINVRAVALCMKHQIPALLASGGGGIVNNASVLGIKPVPRCPIYNASKSAVIGLTRSAALEFAGQGIRINAVCPAVIETDMTADMVNGDPGLRNYMLAMHPVGRFGRAEEIAAAVLYLCGPNSGFVNGIALPVDGGAGI